MRTLLVTVTIVVVLGLFCLGTGLLVARHHRQERRLGASGWQRSDVIGILSLVSSLLLGVASTVVALRSDSSNTAGSHAIDEADIGRLHEAGDVQLFVDVLGPPGYRRPSASTGIGEGTTLSGLGLFQTSSWFELLWTHQTKSKLSQ